MPIFQESDRLQWVSDGQRVTLDAGDGRGRPCIVVVAAGHGALIRPVNGDWERWVRVDQLFPEVTAEMREKHRIAQCKEKGD